MLVRLRGLIRNVSLVQIDPCSGTKYTSQNIVIFVVVFLEYRAGPLRHLVLNWFHNWRKRPQSNQPGNTNFERSSLEKPQAIKHQT